MSKTEQAIAWAINIAQGSSHGYDQQWRWGPDYDCSSLIISAWQQAGVPVRDKGATYTGNMKQAFQSCGFIDVTAQINLYTGKGLKRGDVIINLTHHAIMYIGNGQIVAARINENGQVSGGITGDQTGMEIMIQNYYFYKHGWDCILRYSEENILGISLPITKKRESVTQNTRIKILQNALNLDYNANLHVDGIFCSMTSQALGTHYITVGEIQYMVTAAEILLFLHNYDPQGIEYPGIFGEGLLSALRKFQKAQHLTVTDICDHATFLKLIF